MSFDLPAEATGLCLYRFPSADADPIRCEPVRFPGGRDAVNTALMRAAISGRVELEGKILDHFADVLGADQSILATVALDGKSYGALKNKWMRCKTLRRP